MPKAILEGTKLYSSSLVNTNWACTNPWEAELFEPLDSARQQMKKMQKMEDLASSVETVGDLITQCQRLNRHYAQHPARTRLYFRGETNASWEMRPPQ